jgi:putative transposase
VVYAVACLGRSIRKACELVGLSRPVYRYEARPDRNVALRERLRELAQERRRFGSPRLHLMLRREGLVVNHKRTERLYREEGLALRRKRRRKGASGVRVEPPMPQRPDEKWAMDFVHDSTADGRRFRALVVMDEYTRECPVIEVDRSLGGTRVVRVLDRLAESRCLPETITTDNGPEFTGKALDEWACRTGVKLHFIGPGKPMENAYAESLIGKLRDECLSGNWFLSLADAREIIEGWRKDYNSARPHSSLGGLTPHEYAETTSGLQLALVSTVG